MSEGVLENCVSKTVDVCACVDESVGDGGQVPFFSLYTDHHCGLKQKHVAGFNFHFTLQPHVLIWFWVQQEGDGMCVCVFLCVYL